jgi:integrase
MASIRKRTWTTAGETRTAWVADYNDQGGKRHLKTFPTRKAADAWLIAARADVQRGTHTADSGSITVAKAGELWVDRGALDELERSTIGQRRAHVDLHINPLIGALRLARLSTPTIEAFRDDLLRKNSRAMSRKVLSSLKSILSDAQRRGLVAHNAALPVKVDVKRREAERLAVGKHIPTKAEIRAILDHGNGRYRPLLVTAIFTGMRASELRGLTWDDVDFDRKVVTVRQRADRWGAMGAPKSAAGRREIPMSPMVVNVLREWRLACPKGPLDLAFPNSLGRHEMHFRDHGLNRAQLAAGITDAEGKPRYSFHALRHFTASWLIEQDFSAKRVQAWLGHSSITMTFDTYGHLFPSLEDDHAKIAAGELAVVG